MAVEDYEAGRYALASEGATSAIRLGSGLARDQATYLAGLSAYRLGDEEQAERRLLTASRSTDGEVSSKAKAQLGLIRLDQDRPREAAEMLDKAAEGLTDSDAAKARRYALIAQNRSATSFQAGAADYSRPVASGSKGFVLQVGAFNDRDGARRAASEAEATAVKNHLGSVRVVPTAGARGKRLYVVQMGRFNTRTEAARVLDRLGESEFIVAQPAQAGN